MLWLFICRGNRHPETKVFGDCCHGWDDSKRLIYWPLSAGTHCWIQVSRSTVDIVTACDSLARHIHQIPCGCCRDIVEKVGLLTEDIRYEHAMELPLLKKFRQTRPMVDIVEAGGLVVWMAPESRRLMSTTCILLSGLGNDLV